MDQNQVLAVHAQAAHLVSHLLLLLFMLMGPLQVFGYEIV